MKASSFFRKTAVIKMLLLGFLFLISCFVYYYAKNFSGNENGKLILKTTRVFGIFAYKNTYSVTIDGKASFKVPYGLGDQPSWTKDGAWVAFSRIHGQDPYDSEVYIMRSGSFSIFQITETMYGTRAPTWSPDGNKVAFEASEGIFIQDVSCIKNEDSAGNCPMQAVKVANKGLFPHWSPIDGKIVFTNVDGQILWVDTMNPGKIINITPKSTGVCLAPQWSPDGLHILFSCSRNIYIVREDGNIERFLAEETFGGGSFPRWSSDGKKIFFLSDIDTDLGQPLDLLGSTFSTAIFMMDVDGSNVTRITHRSDENILWYAWMP